MPVEYIDLLEEVRAPFGLTVVVERGRDAREVWDGNASSLLVANRIFLADATTLDEKDLVDQTSPARLGWVMVDVPRVENNQIFAIQVAAKGDWFDKATGGVRNSKVALRQFDRVWRVMKRRLRFPVVARNALTGTEGSYPTIGYTVGAAEWFKSGGQLRQQGVENVEFRIPDPNT